MYTYINISRPMHTYRCFPFGWIQADFVALHVHGRSWEKGRESISRVGASRLGMSGWPRSDEMRPRPSDSRDPGYRNGVLEVESFNVEEHKVYSPLARRC